jgi:hypothetical protein
MNTQLLHESYFFPFISAIVYYLDHYTEKVSSDAYKVQSRLSSDVLLG